MAAVTMGPDDRQALAAGPQMVAIALAGLGVAAAALRGTVAPWLPELVAVVLIVTALGLMLIGMVRRARWHLRRLRDR